MARKCIEPAIVCCSLGCSLMGPIIDCFDLSGSGGGLVPLGASIYKEAEAVLYFCIDFFFSSNKVEYIQFSTSTFGMEFEASSTKEFNRKIC